MRTILALALTLATLSGCSNQGLRDLRNSSDGPDEFIVAPNASLQTPASYQTLPSPTPGQTNLADVDALGDAAIALGGTARGAGSAVPASDAALVTAASRFGTTADIRATLAAADEDFRRRKGRFTQFRITNVGLYDEVYKREAIDPYAEAVRWRNAGVSTPSFPPRN